MEHAISMRWLANLVLIKAIVDFLIMAQMNIAFIIHNNDSCAHQAIR